MSERSPERKNINRAVALVGLASLAYGHSWRVMEPLGFACAMALLLMYLVKGGI